MRILLLLVPILLCLPALGHAQPSKTTTVSGEGQDTPRRLRQPETPESLYNKGLGQMKRGYLDEAIISFEKVRNHFPFNQYSVLAELRVADCLFERQAYLEAVDSYLRFQKLHPRHPEIDYVVYRTARAEFKLAPVVPQRDQSHSSRGLRRLRDFETRFPESQYTGAVLKLRGKALDRLARASIQIGNFYFKQKEWGAAERRYRLAAADYPDAPIVGKARFRQAMCLLKLGEQTAGRDAFGALAVADPESQWGKAALRWIEDNPESEDPSPDESPAPAEPPVESPAPADPPSGD